MSLGQPPLQLIVPAALAASFAFMFPVATPPNAIIFGTGRIRMQQMIRAGLVLNVLGIFVLGLFAYYILPLTLDLSADTLAAVDALFTFEAVSGPRYQRSAQAQVDTETWDGEPMA